MTPAASPSAASAAGYSPGLEGVIAGESAICQVDPDAGLLYRGYPIESFASKVSFEQVAYLLLFGEFPDGGQLATFRAQLAAAASLPDPILSMFQSLPRQTHPMDAIRTGVSMLAGFDPDLNDHSHAANVTKSIRIIARLPTLTAACWRIRSGLEPVAPRADLSCAANLLYMLSGQEPHDWQTQALNTMLNLYAEHEFNASTFAARVTASTLADIYAAITSAIGALKGALHGGANEDAVHVLHDIGSPQNVQAWVRSRLAARQKISGFGHRVYKKGDSRVPSIRALAIQLAQRGSEQDRNLVSICQAMEQVMADAKGLFANADLYAAPVFHMLGLPPALNTPIFACARVAGWCAHVIEQHDHNRIIRPRSLYTGPPARNYTPV